MAELLRSDVETLTTPELHAPILALKVEDVEDFPDHKAGRRKELRDVMEPAGEEQGSDATAVKRQAGVRALQIGYFDVPDEKAAV